MKHLAVMIKPASGRCNMRCAYCFYADIARRREQADYGIMGQETAQKIVDNMLLDLDAGDEATLVFQGGEPTLAGLGFFQYILQYAKEAGRVQGVAFHFALQTNGLTLDEDWMPMLKEYKVLVGVSIDGEKRIHDENRKDSADRGTYKRVMQSKALLEKQNVPYNVLLTLTGQAARHPLKMWQFVLREGIDYIQFTPCLDELDSDEKSPYALTPERFYRFYAALFPLWLASLREGKYISVKLFDDLANYFGKNIPNACGIHGLCSAQFVCEGDGSVFPCDFYVLDEYCMGSLAEERPSALIGKAQPFLSSGRGYVEQEPCASCKYVKSCAGGCKRMVNTMYFSGGLCWYAKLLDEILSQLLRIGSSM